MTFGPATSSFGLVIARNAAGEFIATYMGSDSERQGKFSVQGKAVEFDMNTEPAYGAGSPDFVFRGMLNDTGDEMTGTVTMGPQYTAPTHLKKRPKTPSTPAALSH